MNSIFLQLLIAASELHAPVEPAKVLPEVQFDSSRYCLPLANQGRFDLEAPDGRLIEAGLEDAHISGKKVTFHKALAKDETGAAYYVFSYREYFDIYLVYVTDQHRKELTSKFRYFSKYRPCTAPWPPERAWKSGEGGRESETKR